MPISNFLNSVFLLVITIGRKPLDVKRNEFLVKQSVHVSLSRQRFNTGRAWMKLGARTVQHIRHLSPRVSMDSLDFLLIFKNFEPQNSRENRCIQGCSILSFHNIIDFYLLTDVSYGSSTFWLLPQWCFSAGRLT